MKYSCILKKACTLNKAYKPRKAAWPYFACFVATCAATTAYANQSSDDAALKQQLIAVQKQLKLMAESQRLLQAKVKLLIAASAQSHRRIAMQAEKRPVARALARPVSPAVAPRRELARASPNTQITATPVSPRRELARAFPDTQITATSRSAFIVKPPGAGGGALSARAFDTTVSLYGFVDVSADTAYNGQQRITEVSSNESFVGLRGWRTIGLTSARAIFQIETWVDVSATPGVASSFGSRNSFIGVQSRYGALMAGKNDTPYKRSTALMDPFYASVGDYNSIMGNSAGEGRTEFDYRMPHSIFYDSPSLYGFSANLYSRRGRSSIIYPAAAPRITLFRKASWFAQALSSRA